MKDNLKEIFFSKIIKDLIFGTKEVNT